MKDMVLIPVLSIFSTVSYIGYYSFYAKVINITHAFRKRSFRRQ
jgi:uncharacterized membrane protein HdeD (DUF308 family)